MITDMTSRRIPIQQATHYLPSFNPKTKTTTYTPATGKPDGDWKVVRADVVRYGRNLFKSGAREGEVETDYDRMEAAPVVVYASESAYNRYRIDTYSMTNDDMYDGVDVDNADERAAQEDHERANADEAGNW